MLHRVAGDGEPRERVSLYRERQGSDSRIDAPGSDNQGTRGAIGSGQVDRASYTEVTNRRMTELVVLAPLK